LSGGKVTASLKVPPDVRATAPRSRCRGDLLFEGRVFNPCAPAAARAGTSHRVVQRQYQHEADPQGRGRTRGPEPFCCGGGPCRRGTSLGPGGRAAGRWSADATRHGGLLARRIAIASHVLAVSSATPVRPMLHAHTVRK
jgi:hypothetical protein